MRSGEKERYYSQTQYKKFSLKYRKILDKFAYWDKKARHQVYPTDNTKYLNHSCEPNVLNRGNFDIAKKDIGKGEELTYDYRPILIGNEKLKCNCGSRRCGGLIKPV